MLPCIEHVHAGVHKYRATGRLGDYLLCGGVLIFVGPQCTTCLMSPFWHPEFFVCFLFRVSKILDPCTYIYICRSQWPRGLRRRSAAARLLRSWVRILPRTWMFVCCECCVLSRRGLWDELITRPEESYRLWCVVVCALETSRMRGP